MVAAVIAWVTLFYWLPSLASSVARHRLWCVRDTLFAARSSGIVRDNDTVEVLIGSLQWSIENIRDFTLYTYIFDRLHKRREREAIHRKLWASLLEDMTADERSFINKQMDITKEALLLKVWYGSAFGILSCMVAVPIVAIHSLVSRSFREDVQRKIRAFLIFLQTEPEDSSIQEKMTGELGSPDGDEDGLNSGTSPKRFSWYSRVFRKAAKVIEVPKPHILVLQTNTGTLKGYDPRDLIYI